MENELSLPSFVLADRIHVIYPSISLRLKGRFLYADDDADCLRIVSIDDRGILRRHEADIPLGVRREVEYMASASRAFLIDDDLDGIMKIDDLIKQLARQCGPCGLDLHTLAVVVFVMFLPAIQQSTASSKL
jgi:hypothetical protein